MSFKILYTADLHGSKEFCRKLIDKAQETELRAVVIGGDLCPRNGSTVAESVQFQKEFLNDFFIPEFAKLEKDVFVIMGNDDFRANEHILFQKKHPNIKYIHKRRFRLFSKNIVGYSFVNPTPFRLKDWEKFDDEERKKPHQNEEVRTVDMEKGTIEEDLKNLKKLSNPEKTVYVMHAPPFDTKLDVITDGSHVGSRAVRNFIETDRPYLTLHGHIHESPRISGSWIDKIGDTICINVGSSYPKNKLNCVVVDLVNQDVKYMEI